MENFTPWSALTGGALIGAAAGLLYILNGRIAGISGIVNGAIRPVAGDVGWRVAFLVGLVAGSLSFVLAAPLPFEPRDGFPLIVVAVAGFLVGFGTRMGSGCTSGHGVCGLARLSPRSLAATLTFLATGMLTVFFVTRWVWGG